MRCSIIWFVGTAITRPPDPGHSEESGVGVEFDKYIQTL